MDAVYACVLKQPDAENKKPATINDSMATTVKKFQNFLGHSFLTRW